MPRWLRALTVLMMLMFLFGAIVQYNDPDPLRWILIYLAATVACVLALLQRMPRWLPATVAAVALVWALLLLPRVFGVVSPLDMFDEFEMKSEPIEVAREGYGLLIIFVGMVVLFSFARRQQRGATAR